MTATGATARHRSGTRPRAGAQLLGVVGEVLITLGALLALFVAWQLWWTDVAANQNQTEVIRELPWASMPLPDAEASASPAPVTPVTPHRDPAPSVPDPEKAATFGVLYVPRWGVDYERPISEGIDREKVLNVLGIGHYPGTALPGQVGNFAVAAHRTTYGKPFSRIAELREGDVLVVRTESTWYVYRVTGHEIVRPEQVEVIAPVPDRPGEAPTTAAITLTTCHPQYSARERYVVHGVLDYWLPVSEGTPTELGAEGGGS